MLFCSHESERTLWVPSSWYSINLLHRVSSCQEQKNKHHQIFTTLSSSMYTTTSVACGACRLLLKLSTVLHTLGLDYLHSSVSHTTTWYLKTWSSISIIFLHTRLEHAITCYLTAQDTIISVHLFCQWGWITAVKHKELPGLILTTLSLCFQPNILVYILVTIS